ncbi:MAG: flagellar hook-associated protein FlgK [Epulopiscium sp. Nele67-Bin005]|nr:MAG: flagellar hook-associated protein FlgK [Epulopiscium sp. Nele67-Bin005]
MSSFSEYNIALSGLFAAQQGLSVTANNIANSATLGYSRQVMTQQATLPVSGNGIGMYGTGVEVTSIDRVRNSFLDQKMWAQSPTLGEYSIKMEQTSLIEEMFGEPSDEGFTAIFNGFFEAIDDMSKNPEDSSCAYAAQQSLISFAQYYNTMSSTLTSFQRDLNFELSAVVDEINLLAQQIQSLNQAIYTYEMHGASANELRDQRDLCMDQLSLLVNVEAKEVEVIRGDGNIELQYIVYLNDQTLVNHLDVRTLDVEVRSDAANDGDAINLYDIVWSDGLPFNMDDNNLSGELKGIIDMRDGAGITTYNGIPYYRERLDSFVQGFAEAMNEIYNSDGNGGQLVPPQYLFSYTDENGNIISADDPTFDYSNMTAENFSISAQLLEDPLSFRTNFDHVPNLDDPSLTENPNPGSNDLLIALLGQKDNDSMFREGDPKDYMITIFTELGVRASEAKMYQEIQTSVVNAIENQRLSVSQVDQNEEMMNLVMYNQAYQMAARVMSTIDGIYDLTINRLGAW